MRTKVCEMFGIELPIFAFTHCRDVVAEVSKAGGMGIFGCSHRTPEELEIELKWIDDHVDGKPYGIDLLMPGKFSKITDEMINAGNLENIFPKEQTEFVRRVLEQGGVKPLTGEQADEFRIHNLKQLRQSVEEHQKFFDVAFNHPVKLIVSALGVAPKTFIDQAHSRGVKVGALVGAVEHARRQKAAGVDLIIAVGGEAGGHTGTIASLVLWPQVVDAVAPLPVLAAGGVGRGRQLAAALALGAEGVWCGSIWLGTKESDTLPELKEKIYAATSGDTIRTTKMTGKGARFLTNKYTEAWEQPGAPKALPLPFQLFLSREAQLSSERARAKDYLATPMGQIVGEINAEQRVRDVIYQMLDEFAESYERFSRIMNVE